MRIRASQLKAGDETLKGFIIASIEQAAPEMLKVTYTAMIPNTNRNWEYVHPNGYAYIEEREGEN